MDEHERVLDELAVDVSRLADVAEQLLGLETVGTQAATDADVGEVVARVVGQRDGPDAGHGTEVSAKLPELPLTARIDPVALERALSNLIDNARKHGRAPVTMTVREARRTATGGASYAQGSPAT